MGDLVRYFAALLVLLFTASPARGQGLSAGLIAGVNASTFSDFGDVGPATERRQVGLIAGVSLDVPLARWASFAPEAVYTQKGARLEAPVLPGSASTAVITQRLGYLEVPILVRLGSTPRSTGPYVVAGPAVAALLHAREHIDAPGFPTQDQDIKDGVTSADAGIVLGAGFSIGRLGVEGRFEAGLRNLIPPADRAARDPEPTNRSLTVVARLRL